MCNQCTKCTDGLIRITLENGKSIVVPCDYCGGYGEHEEVMK